MNTEHLKHGIAHVAGQLQELAARARELENQNLADIIDRARAKLEQAAEHPNIDRLSDLLNGAPPALSDGKPLVNGSHAHTLQPEYSDPNAVPWAPAPDASTAQQPADAPKHPGDPQFAPENNNLDFKQPNDVDLNDDGTLREAPNSFAQPDNRDK